MEQNWPVRAAVGEPSTCLQHRTGFTQTADSREEQVSEDIITL